LEVTMSANLSLVECNPPSSSTISVHRMQRLQPTLNFLLNLNANVDDRHRAQSQEVVRRALSRAPLNSTVYVLATAWKCVLANQNNLSLSLWAEEWTRRLSLIKAFLQLRDTYDLLLSTNGEAPAGPGDSGNISNHSMSSVLCVGDGRIAELLATWLHHLGQDVRSLVHTVEAVETSEKPHPAHVLLQQANRLFPAGSCLPVLLVHLAWVQLQAWSRTRDKLSLISPSLLPGLWAISCPNLRSRFLSLAWRTFFSKMLQDTARLTETMAKTVVNRVAKCEELLGMAPHSVPAVLGLMAQLLDCHLQTLTIAGDQQNLAVGYDHLGEEARPHLLDHVKAVSIPDVELVSLTHQLCLALELSWTLRVDLRPGAIFSSGETRELVEVSQHQGIFSNLFLTDHNVSVNRQRAAWIHRVTEAATGHIHLRPGDGGRQYDTENFQQLMGKLQQLAKVWFLQDLVRQAQVESLYRCGHDSLALELRPSVTDVQSLANKTLEVALLRLAKHVWGGESQGRLAALPPTILSHLAERKEACNSIAEAGLVDTVALLAWTAQCLEDPDSHSLATAALAAGQVLTVRNNRAAT